ncbi:MAG: MgtC/SapB family protein [Clostridiales bacterium]|nr:MgtC/SapB family protein [Clostridiales bacterium]
MNDLFADILGEWSKGVNIGSVSFKIAVAVIFAAVLGCERARNRHAAGLRTFIVVSLASTVVAIADLFLIGVYGITIPFLSAATVIGIAIISSNTILFSSKNQLKGLTTSAGLWADSIISVILGLGLYTVAFFSFVVLMLSLTVFTKLEKITKRKSNHFEVHLELKGRNLLQEFTATIREFGLKIDNIEINPAYANSGLGVYTIALTVADKELKKKTHKEIVSALSALDCVSYIEEI